MYERVLQRRRNLRVRMAVGLVVAGVAVLALLAQAQSFPRPFWLWVVFAIAFVYLEWRSVEINDHLFVSPSVMVAITAAVVFGKGSAALGVAAMAGLAFLHPSDIQGRRWFQPMVNFGQFVVSATVSMSILEFFLPETLGRSHLWQVAIGAAAASIVYHVVNFTMVSWIVRQVYEDREILPWASMGANHFSYLGMGFLGGLLGATYVLADETLGPLPLIFAVFFVGHMTFASYAELRQAQEATLRGFIKALEAKDLYTRGHTERVAYFSQLIGEELGYSPNQQQRLRWAALIHDVGKLAVPRELIRKKSRLSEEEYAQMQRHVHAVEDILAEVQFLQPMVRIASGHHSHFDGNGYGGSEHNHGETPGRDACVLAVADAFDAMTSSRSYRMALTQDYAFEELRRNSGSQFDPDVVEALIRALQRTGERFGSSDLADEEEARRLAEAMEGYRIYG